MKKPLLIVAGAVAVLALGGYVAISSRSEAASKHRGAAARAQKQEAKKTRAIELQGLAYPRSDGALPRSIEVSFDAAKDHSKMVLQLTDLSVTSAGAFRAQTVCLRLTSDFEGKVRTPEKPESSINGSLTAHTDHDGLLAYSTPPGIFTADKTPVQLREHSSKKSGYASVKAGGGFDESVRFKIPTEGLLKVAAATNVSLKVGALEVTLTPVQITDLRKFAARLNPHP